MKRAQFFQGIFALLGFGQGFGTIQCSKPGHNTVEGPCPAELKAGEERCPLGHVQEPLEAGFLMAGWISGNGFDGNGFDGYQPSVIRTRKVHVCGVCSIMYAVYDVQKEKK